MNQREIFIDNLLLRIHVIIEMIWWTGLAPWEFEFSLPGSLTSKLLVCAASDPKTVRRIKQAGRERESERCERERGARHQVTSPSRERERR